MHRLREFEVVALALPAASRTRDDAFLCHVIAMAGTTVALQPVEMATVTWLPERVSGAFLMFPADRPQVALKGDLFQRGSIGDLRFKMTATAPRRASRLKACLPVSLRVEGSEEARQRLTIDLSADGLLIECPGPETRVGDRAEVTLSLPGVDAPIESAATVVRTAGRSFALQLDTANTDARRALAIFVFERNRAALRRRPREDEPDF